MCSWHGCTRRSFFVEGAGRAAALRSSPRPTRRSRASLKGAAAERFAKAAPAFSVCAGGVLSPPGFAWSQVRSQVILVEVRADAGC